MPQTYIVRLTDEERAQCHRVIKHLSGKSRKVRRSQILLQADVDGPAKWADEQIAQAYHCSVQSVANLRKRLVSRGFSTALNGLRREKPPRSSILDGEQQARLIALRLGSPPPGYSNWSLRLLSERVVALGIVEAISHETCRQVLKKTGCVIKAS